MRRVALLVLVACHHGGAATRCDTSTDDGVRAAYKKATGKDLPPKSDYQCIEHASSFPAVVKIGSFADDRGCMWEGVLYGCAFSNAADLQAQVLADAGWATADQAGKERLVRDYWSGVYDVFFTDSGDPRITAPAFTWAADGSATFDYWSQENRGMLPGSHYEHHRDAIPATGAHADGTLVESFDTER